MDSSDLQSRETKTDSEKGMFYSKVESPTSPLKLHQKAVWTNSVETSTVTTATTMAAIGRSRKVSSSSSACQDHGMLSGSESLITRREEEEEIELDDEQFRRERQKCRYCN